jgi:hypothetical protein
MKQKRRHSTRERKLAGSLKENGKAMYYMASKL